MTVFIQSAISMVSTCLFVTTAWPSTWMYACKGQWMGMCVVCRVCHTAQERMMTSAVACSGGLCRNGLSHEGRWQCSAHTSQSFENAGELRSMLLHHTVVLLKSTP